jgi:hypothetical protein
VKLTGTLVKPQWAFVIGPTNFLRALAPGSDATTKADPPREKNELTEPPTPRKEQLPPPPPPKS